MTPHAPCTPDWTKKPPAASPPKLSGMIQRGIHAAVQSARPMIVQRRPMICEMYPPNRPPATAPQLEMITATLSLCLFRPLVLVRYVG